MSPPDSRKWARSEFGHARLGDQRRTERLVEIAAAVLEHPAGKVTEVFDGEADREGAYRLLQNDAVEAGGILQATQQACAERCAGSEFVFVPVDGTSLTLEDRNEQKRLGLIGSRQMGVRGLEVMTAIAVSPQGVPLGICGQEYWARKPAPAGKSAKKRRPTDERETVHWLNVMQQVRSALLAGAPKTKAWFQLDRGGDAWPVLLEGLEPEQLFTVRAARNRRLWDDREDGSRSYLWDELDSAQILGSYSLAVPGGPNRQARKATMEVRSTRVVLRLFDERANHRYPGPLFAVLAREVSPVPATETPVEWLLLTTYEVHTFADATAVIQGYAQRWRIEQFHRTWKTGACRVEETQLGDRDHIIRWALILASVAMRILRMTYLARHQPELAADREFKREEIDAVILLRKPQGYARGQTPTIGEVVRWIADLGGYTGRSSGGPPGPIVIRRGLERIQGVVQVLSDGNL